MFRSSLVLLPLAISGALGNSLQQRATCSNVHIFVTRGNDEPYPGRQGALTDAICSHFPNGCAAEHIEYDNPAANACDALTKGPQLAIAQITAYHNACPNSIIVLTGYSQGAQTMGDVLGGGGGQFWNCIEPTVTGFDPNTGVGSMIAAALLWGDARHTAGQSYNVLSGANKNGYFPRSGAQLTSLNRWSDRLRSYCVDTDPICARGNDGHTHETYFDINDSEAANWVATKVNAFKAPAAPSSTPVAPTTSSSSSSSAAVSSSAVSSGSVAASSTSSATDSAVTSSSSLVPANDGVATSSSSVSSVPASSYVDSTFITSLASYSYGYYSSAIPYQSTATDIPYGYPVMASNTVPAGTTYSTAPSSTPAPIIPPVVTAYTTSSPYGNATVTTASASPIMTYEPNAASVKQISALIVAAAFGVFAL